MTRPAAPSAPRSDGRQAIIDIGSNTVRLVIYGGARRAPLVLFNEKVAARLGSGLASTGALSEDSARTALAGLARFAAILSGLGVRDVEAVATAAVRDASNGPEFLDRVRALGLNPRLLSGEEEASASASGVLGAFPGASGVVADLGGGSLELIAITPKGREHGVSLPLGTLRLAEMPMGGSGGFGEPVLSAIASAGWNHPAEGALYLVGGTWRSLASFCLHRAGSVLDDPHGLELALPEAFDLAGAVAKSRPDDLKAAGISSMRATALPASALLLLELLRILSPRKVVFSSWGLREGLLFERLDPVARMQDPLLAGVAAFTAPRGGDPSLAAQVAGWTVGAVPPDGVGSERLRLAATMLALASNQIEPNFRARHALDWALHKRWIDLTSEGRGLIATALHANCGKSAPPAEARGLASPELLSEAVAWGLAIRLCRRLGANAAPALEGSVLRAGKNRLRLVIGEGCAALFTRSVEKDLARLATALRLEPAAEIVPDSELPGQRARRAPAEEPVSP